MGETGKREDAAVGGHFTIEIEDLTLGQFNSASGLEIETDIVEYREGGNNAQTLKFRGPARYANIVLERGFVVSKELWDWYLDCQKEDDEMKRKNGSIVLKNSQGDELARWNFEHGWPCRWSGPTLHAAESGTAVEMLEIAHEKLEFKKS